MSRSWTPFYWGDYLKHTGHLTTEQHGIYFLLLAHYYSTGKPPPDDPKQLLSICRCFALANGEQEASIKSILDQFFELRDGRWHNVRADAEIEKANEISNKRAEAGRKGGQANAKQLPTQPQPQYTATVTTTERNTPQPPSRGGNGANKKSTRPRFKPPTYKEVRAYCQERENGVNPVEFVDFYTSKNWMVGKSKMVDWQAAVRTWERRH